MTVFLPFPFVSFLFIEIFRFFFFYILPDGRGTTIAWIARFVIIVMCIKCFIPTRTFNFISFMNTFLLFCLIFVSVSNVCVQFDSSFILFKFFWFSMSIWIMVVFYLCSWTRFLFCCWRTSVNSLFVAIRIDYQFWLKIFLLDKIFLLQTFRLLLVPQLCFKFVDLICVLCCQ